MGWSFVTGANRHSWRMVAGLLGVLILALVVRLQPWSDVFPAGKPGAVFVGDTDTYYHVLRADRIAQHYPQVPWRDDGMNFPLGADILWPPLFDHAIASIAFVSTSGHPTRAAVESVAALLPPLIGVATVAVVAALGYVLLEGGAWLGAALLFALLPAHVEFSVVGRPDQHVAESLLQALIMLTFVHAWRIERGPLGRWCSALMLGSAIALSFWNWQGSVVYLVLLSAFSVLWHLIDSEGVVARRAHAALARGAGVGVLLLVVSILLWGRPGALFVTSLSGINGIQAVLTALVAVFALVLRLTMDTRRKGAAVGRRALEALAAGVIAIAATLVLLPALRSGLVQGWAAFTAGNPWYASIREFQAPLFGGTGIRRELAAWIPRFAPMFVMPLAGLGLARVWRRRPERRPAVAFLAVWGTALLLITLTRLRFSLYLSIPATLWAALGLRELCEAAGANLAGRWVRPAVAVTGMTALLAPAVFYFAHGGLRPDPTQSEVIAALAWLRDRPSPDPGRTAVFGEWDWGHLIQYFGSRPAVATPFGTDGGAGAMEDSAAFFLATSPDQAGLILERRRAGYLLLVDPVTHAAESAAYAPPGAKAPVAVTWDRIRGPQIAVSPEIDDLVAVRIYFDNGLSSRGLPTLANYRLVYEGSPAVPRQVRLFEIVPGATLLVRGALARATIRAASEIHTQQGRATNWYASASADEQGRASLAVPFSTGQNGTVVAGPCRVTCGGTETVVAIPSQAVERGASIDVLCGATRQETP